MRRINIKKDNKLVTITCSDYLDLFQELKCNSIFKDVNLDLSNLSTFLDKIWDLNVGSKLECWGYTFSIQSKRRTGNKMINNTRIGDQI